MVTNLAQEHEGAREVDREDPVPRGGVVDLGRQSTEVAHAGVVDEDVDLPVFLDAGLHHTLDVVFHCDVPGGHGDLRAKLSAAFSNGLEHVLRTSGQHEVGALLGETFGEAFAEAVGRTRDQNGLAGELAHVTPLAPGAPCARRNTRSLLAEAPHGKVHVQQPGEEAIEVALESGRTHLVRGATAA